MKRLLLLTVSILLLFTACSPVRDPLSEKEKPDLEELSDGLFADYDRSKFENVTPPKPYYAEYVTFEDEDMLPFFSEPPEIYTVMEHEIYPYRRFKNDGEWGYYTNKSLAYGKDLCNELSIIFSYYLGERPDIATEGLDFMTLSEVRERFADDMHRFVPDFRIYDLFAITAEDFAKAAAETDPPYPEKGWREPKDFYYIRARQYLNDIPLFAGVTTISETLQYNGSEIHACYSADGVEEFRTFCFYNVLEEAPVHGDFISLSEAEQIIREEYTMPYGYDQIILFDVDLVYKAVNDDDGRMILTPVWEFYEDIWSLYEVSYNHYFTTPWIKINAYTGEFMW